MEKISHILKSQSHRPWELPKGKWAYYQEWNKAIFLHWKVPSDILKPLIPSHINIDTFANESWISLVAFTMERIRPRYLPAFPPVSNFHEINLRTYVTANNKPGVYFLSIEGQKSLSVWIAKKLSGLPYEKSNIQRPTTQTYICSNKISGNNLNISFHVEQDVMEKSALEKWLIERYCLYLEKGEKTYRYEIHHKEWDIKKLTVDQLELNYAINKRPLTNKPDLIHYSNGVQVIAWERELLKV